MTTPAKIAVATDAGLQNAEHEVDVYLDVDGVLNAVTHKTPRWDWGCEPQRVGVLGFGITWAPPLIERLNALADKPYVHFHWLTTWLDKAPSELASQIGLNGQDWPVLGHEDHNAPRKFSDYSWWKLSAARRAAESGRRIVWIDDDLMDTSAREWAATLGPRIMLVQPDCSVGLTLGMVDMIEKWIGESA